MPEINVDPFNTLETSENRFAAQPKMPNWSQNFQQMSEAAQIVTAAQLAFGKELMRANALLFGRLLAPAPPASELRPSQFVHSPDRVD